ncbi:MAG TPA: hypothetical protein VKA37_04135, partial [Halobacteriales archaeon]|nr:hypothetical protein [Halobacteriales archaeon]
PSDSSDGPPETATFTDSDRIRLLASNRRRVLLDVVEDRSTPVALETLAAAVGEAESGAGELERETVDRIAITLHHNHLPRLADAGVLDYDPASNHVAAVRGFPTD